MMKGKKKRSFKQLIKEAADGKDTNQDDINALAQSQMNYMMPVMMLFIMISLPGALVLYYLLNTSITVFLQKIVLNKNLEQMEEAADKKILKELRDTTKKIKEAEVVAPKSHYAKDNKNKNDKVHITRITASDKKKRRK